MLILTMTEAVVDINKQIRQQNHSTISSFVGLPLDGYAVIDTNVLISAMLKWNSVPGNVMEFTFSGTIIPVLNEHIVHEYREVLSRPKFKFTKDIIDTVVNEIERLGVYIDAPELEVELPDPKDRVFYEVVMEERNAEDAYLVTGNLKHFPEEPFIVTPRQMVDIIIENMEE